MTYDMRKFYRCYGFSGDTPLTKRQLDQLITCFRQPSNSSDTTLGGRRQMPILTLEPFGSVVVKCYRRSGLMGRFNHRHYLNLKGRATRSGQEYAWLNRVRAMGIKAPEPLVAASQGRLVYRCWLVTREVTGAISLAQLSIDRPAAIGAVCSTCARQIDILLENRILHPDLHPGNVLVDHDGQPWIIDFDKARHYRGGRQRLIERYRRRWGRAVRKHGLSPELDAVMTPSRNVRQD